MSNNCFVMSLTHYSCCQTKKGFVNAAFLPFAKPSRIFNFVEAHCQVPYSQPGGGGGGAIWPFGPKPSDIYFGGTPKVPNQVKSLIVFSNVSSEAEMRKLGFAIPTLSTVLSANKMFGGDWWSSGWSYRWPEEAMEIVIQWQTVLR